MTVDQQEEAARSQSLWRAVNENIKNVQDELAPDDTPRAFLCECVHGCKVTFELRPSEYEAIRADGRRFVVAPSDEHVLHDVEVVLAREEEYWVVKKVGHGADLAAALDPRTDAST